MDLQKLITPQTDDQIMASAALEAIREDVLDGDLISVTTIPILTAIPNEQEAQGTIESVRIASIEICQALNLRHLAAFNATTDTLDIPAFVEESVVSEIREIFAGISRFSPYLPTQPYPECTTDAIQAYVAINFATIVTPTENILSIEKVLMVKSDDGQTFNVKHA